MIINLIIQRLGMVCENKQKIKRKIKRESLMLLGDK